MSVKVVRPRVTSDEGLPPKKRRRIDPRGCNWFMTWNNYPGDWKEQLGALAGLSKYCCQPEVGEETGTPHIQGVLVFKTQRLRSTLYNHLEGVRLRKARNLFACVNYCRKVETRAGAVWTKGFHIPKKVRDPLAGVELYTWQKDILELVEQDPDDRSIYWYWSDEGGIGKSSLCKHLVLKQNAIVVGGTHRDAYYAIMQRVQAGVAVDLVIFDICRAKCKDGKPMISYSAIEGIKNGMFFSAKYESGMCVYNCPHVMVFANCVPDKAMLSEDRWKIKCLDENDFSAGVRANLATGTWELT